MSRGLFETGVPLFQRPKFKPALENGVTLTSIQKLLELKYFMVLRN
jgi:hypothetical protein